MSNESSNCAEIADQQDQIRNSNQRDEEDLDNREDLEQFAPVGPSIRIYGGVLQGYTRYYYRCGRPYQVYNWTRDGYISTTFPSPFQDEAITWSSPIDPSGSILMSRLLAALEEQINNNDPGVITTSVMIPWYTLQNINDELENDDDEIGNDEFASEFDDVD